MLSEFHAIVVGCITTVPQSIYTAAIATQTHTQSLFCTLGGVASVNQAPIARIVHVVDVACKESGVTYSAPWWTIVVHNKHISTHHPIP